MLLVHKNGIVCESPRVRERERESFYAHIARLLIRTYSKMLKISLNQCTFRAHAILMLFVVYSRWHREEKRGKKLLSKFYDVACAMCVLVTQYYKDIKACAYANGYISYLYQVLEWWKMCFIAQIEMYWEYFANFSCIYKRECVI